ncbi:hypothetical protein QBC37DRAFT_444918 [Rhypophila decipiens]|uniref:Alternative oxidase n=1 Tax=Rhypophila decipiens TaxID=261697 RepID=A0AAN7B1R4_9PEZI|nr:hypothetical protein QBC37DRAFT_444918 [Rhypophila decipiens]
MARYRNILVTSFFVSLITLWLCRLPHLSWYNQAAAFSSPASTASADLDLSRVDAPFVSWPLARVCKETTWNPGVVFICDDNSGGIGNIRNYLLTCVRYAIEAGATGLVLPRIRGRSSNDLADLFVEHQPFEYYFDKKHFTSSLQTACPEIAIYKSVNDIPNAGKPLEPEKIQPITYTKRGGCDQRELNKHSDRFGIEFRKHMEKTSKENKFPFPSMEHPRAYAMAWGVQFDLQVYRDGPEFVSTFGGLLKFRKDIMDLGLKTAKYMRQYATTQGTTPPDKRIGSTNFTGMHLRSESDALAFWPKFEQQSHAYLEKTRALEFHAAYLATGNETEADKLTEIARSKYLIGVMTKRKLLEPYHSDLKALDKLTWDQQALIDYIVLLECQYFTGVSPSSFSMNVALKRHTKMDGLYTRPWKIGREDERSMLVGSYEKYWEDWLFMFDSIWP